MGRMKGAEVGEEAGEEGEEAGEEGEEAGEEGRDKGELFRSEQLRTHARHGPLTSGVM
jgi:hypothetical protein